MEPLGTPALTGYSCEYLPSRTTRSRLSLRKEEIRPIISNSIRLKFEEDQRAKPCQKPWMYQVLRVAPDLIKALTILSDTTARRSAVDREDLKP